MLGHFIRNHHFGVFYSRHEELLSIGGMYADMWNQQQTKAEEAEPESEPSTSNKDSQEDKQ